MSQDTGIKRISPRRPYRITGAGIKRMVLGASDGLSADVDSAPLAHDKAKPLRSPAQAQARVLVIAHSDRGMLDAHAQQTLAAAAILADSQTAVLALILGDLGQNLAAYGADEYLVMPELDYQRYQPEAELACALAVIAEVEPMRIYLPDNELGDGNLGRRISAHYPQKSCASHVVEITSDKVASYQAGGTQLAHSALPDIVLLAADAVDPTLHFVGAALPRSPVAELTLHMSAVSQSSQAKQPSVYQDLGMHSMAASEVALEEADFIVAAGNGVQQVATFTALAQLLDAAIGASRVAVDDGRFRRDQQIGASGKTVSASVYLAIGISGAIQHLQGIKDCRHVIAINRDPSSPIIKRANLSIIGDAEDIMQQLMLCIDAAKQPKLEEAA